MITEKQGLNVILDSYCKGADIPPRMLTIWLAGTNAWQLVKCKKDPQPCVKEKTGEEPTTCPRQYFQMNCEPPFAIYHCCVVFSTDSKKIQ